MNRPKIAILGSGPAGLMAAHAVYIAASDAGKFPSMMEIFSLGEKSPLYGAQYLHAPIPGVTLDNGTLINYTMQGTTEGYRRKVYGDDWDGTVSPEDLSSEHYGWDLRATYNQLWRAYSSKIEQIKIDSSFVNELLGDGWLVVSTIPAPTLCAQAHSFLGQPINAAGDAPELGISLPYAIPEYTVMCNGEDNGPAWYRASNIFGHRTVEWPDNITPPIRTAAKVIKPLKHTCNCFEDFLYEKQLLKVGRYGAWKKGVLSHHAFEDALGWAKEVFSQ